MDDLISRQAAIDMFQRLAYDDWNQGTGTTWASAFSEAADMIENLPSAQPERKHGKWIRMWKNNFECSNCGSWWGSNSDSKLSDDFAFCPNCGAEMREKEGEI